jgi:hypothetical protein
MRLFAKHIGFVRGAFTVPALLRVNSENKEFRPDLAVDDVVRA